MVQRIANILRKRDGRKVDEFLREMAWLILDGDDTGTKRDGTPQRTAHTSS